MLSRKSLSGVNETSTSSVSLSERIRKEENCSSFLVFDILNEYPAKKSLSFRSFVNEKSSFDNTHVASYSSVKPSSISKVTKQNHTFAGIHDKNSVQEIMRGGKLQFEYLQHMRSKQEYLQHLLRYHRKKSVQVYAKPMSNKKVYKKKPGPRSNYSNTAFQGDTRESIFYRGPTSDIVKLAAIVSG